MTLLLLPGLGADARLFDDLRPHAPPFVVPAWRTPLPDESLRDYARRWAPSLSAHERPRLLAGMSFGGQVALELADVLRPDAVLLLASHPDGSEVSARFRRQVRVLPFVPDRALRFGLVNLGMPAIARDERLAAAQRERLRAMARAADLTFFRWAARAAARWDRAAHAASPCRVRRLHGEGDRVIPLGRRDGVELLANAGHLLPMTHAKEVGEWLRREVAACV